MFLAWCCPGPPDAGLASTACMDFVETVPFLPDTQVIADVVSQLPQDVSVHPEAHHPPTLHRTSGVPNKEVVGKDVEKSDAMPEVVGTPEVADEPEGVPSELVISPVEDSQTFFLAWDGMGKLFF